MMRFAKITAAILLAAVLLASCGSELITLKYEDGLFVSARNGLSYLPAPITYEPASVGEPYARYEKGNATLCRIGDSDPTQWLAEDAGGGVSTVFYSSSITLPDLAALGAEKIVICDSDVITVGIAEITDAALIAEIVKCFTEGENAVWPLIDSAARYELKFFSPAWPQICINLIWGSFPEGKFLYDRGSGRCVEIGGLLDAYLLTEAEK